MVRGEIHAAFERVLGAQCAFKDVVFERATFRDTVFIDCFFDNVMFRDCDLRVATFKGNAFTGCQISHCATDNRLFEHCVFFQCHMSNITLLDATLLQNFGLRQCDTDSLMVIDGATHQLLEPSTLKGTNALEDVALDYFLGGNLDQSSALGKLVQLHINPTGALGLLHTLTAIRQLAAFLLGLYQRNEIRLYFPLRLYWTLHHLLDQQETRSLPQFVLERVHAAASALGPLSDELTRLLPIGNRYELLIREDVSRDEFRALVHSTDLSVTIGSFRRYNSPSIVEIASARGFDALLLAALVLCTKFKFEISRFRAQRKLFEVETKLLTAPDGTLQEYAMALAINVPFIFYSGIHAHISLGIINKLRTVVLDIVSPNPSGSS